MRALRTVAPPATALLLAAGGVAVPSAARGVVQQDSRPVEPTVVRLVGGAVKHGGLALASGTTDVRARYSMVAVTWQRGAPVVRVRTHGADGWRAWRPLAELADGPTRRPGPRGTELLWVGPSDRLRLEVTGSGADSARLLLLDPQSREGDAAAGRAPAVAPARTAKPRSAPRPYLRGRKKWHANEKWRRSKPRYNRTIQQVHIHHTATGTDYRRWEVPKILRAIYRYHTKTLKWSDIGYNFVVDRFGRAWVGRAGGIDKPVRGAHTLGFNNTSVGVAVLGNFETKTPRREIVTMLAKIAAWKLDAYDRDPRQTVRVFSHGSDLYPRGERVRLPAIDGHRDTNSTACPGQRLYDRLDQIREAAGARVDAYS